PRLRRLEGVEDLVGDLRVASDRRELHVRRAHVGAAERWGRHAYAFSAAPGAACSTFCKYTTAVNVLSSSNTWYARRSCASFATLHAGSAASPNTIARDGHACAHAVVNSSAASGRPSRRARCSASRMRCTQKVHFSITPLPRTVTSGFSS